MSLTIKHRPAKAKETKKAAKTETVAVEDAATQSVAQLVDELGKLCEKVKPLADRIDAIKKELVARAKTKGNDKYVFEGATFKATVQAPRIDTVVTNIYKAEELLEAVKEGLFHELAKLKVTDLQAYLTPDELPKCTEQQATETRVVKTERKK